MKIFSKRSCVKSNSEWQLNIAQAKLKIIEQSFKDALKFLKKTHKSFFYKYKIPWYLIIGAEGAGKSNLLAKSGIEFFSTDAQPLKMISSTAYSDWWFSNESVIIDLSGKLIIQQSIEHDPSPIWNGFLKLLKHYRRRQPINGIIVAVDISTSYANDKSSQQLQYDSICHHIQTLANYIKELPIYLVFTKCDLVTGFCDFFTHMSLEEQEQICGISLPQTIDQQNLPRVLSEHYDIFLKRLHEQLMWRLHHERQPSVRARIYDFPLQLESQKQFIINLASQLNSSRAHIRGIYFTSSLRDGKTVDYLMQPLMHNLNIHHLDTILNIPQDKSFFIRNIFKNILSMQTAKSHWQLSFSRYYKLNIVAGLIILSFCLYNWQSYTHNLKVINNTSSLINQIVHGANNNTSYTFLPKLNALKEALESSDFNQHHLLNSFHYTHQLKATLEKDYYQIIMTDFAPQLQQILETQIQEANNNPELLYNTLKVYLILGRVGENNLSIVQEWFKNYWKKTLLEDPQTQAQLQKHLQSLLMNKQIKIHLNSQLVRNARAELTHLELEKLLYLLLQDQYYKTTVKLNSVTVTIPSLYTPYNFNDIYYKTIPLFCQQNVGNYWVLGSKPHLNNSQEETDKLITEVRKLYVNHYILAWQEQLATLKIADFHNLKEAKASLEKLSGDQSPFIQILNNWKISLQPVIALPEFKQVVADQLSILNQQIAYAKNPSTQKALHDVVYDLNHIVASPNNNSAAWAMAKSRMENNLENDSINNLFSLAHQAPAPFDIWLTNIGNDCWRMILQSSVEYLNQVWSTEVLPQYNNYVKYHYPIFKEANNEMQLNEFRQFFGPNGTMDSFFTHYLQPFVDTSQLYWTWKVVNKQKINIPQSTLETFIRAALIRKMYFPENSSKPHMQFTLIGDSFITSAQDFILNIEGQIVNYKDDLHKSITFEWPGPKPEFVSAEFVDKDNKPIQKIEMEGPWAIFRFFDKALLATTQNAKFYKLSLDLSGNIVKYELMAEDLINPFIPGIINNFRCPEKL